VLHVVDTLWGAQEKLDEQRVPPGFDQVCDVGAAQRVEIHARAQSQAGAQASEAGVDLCESDPWCPLRGPQCRGGRDPGAGEQGTDLGGPLDEGLADPGPDG
jgi:hypothetical protein